MRRQQYNRDKQAVFNLLKSQQIDASNLSLDVNTGEDIFTFTTSETQIQSLANHLGIPNPRSGCDPAVGENYCNANNGREYGGGGCRVDLPGVASPDLFVICWRPGENQTKIRMAWQY